MDGAVFQMMAAAARSFDSAESTVVQLPLHLDRVPAMLQYALESHAVQRSHVMYQSMERWLLEGFGMADAEHAGHFDNLREYGIAQRALFGSSCTNFTHGPGTTGSECNTTRAHFERHNSGQFSEKTIKRALPASALPGVQLHCLLNFFEDVRCDSGNVTYAPSEGCLVTLVNVATDGMSLGAGAMVDERNLQVIGFDEPIGIEVASEVLQMEDTELQAWTKQHPFLSDALEFIACAADNSVSGNLGYLFVPGKGTHADVARRLISMLRPLRTCYCCLRCVVFMLSSE